MNDCDCVQKLVDDLDLRLERLDVEGQMTFADYLESPEMPGPDHDAQTRRTNDG